MNGWKVAYTEQAEEDLNGIYEYIAFSLHEPEIAKKQAKRIMEAAVKLNEMAFRFRLYKNEPWHRRGLRVLPVDNYLVFYLPVEEESTVAIIRIMYGGRNIEEQFFEDI